MHIYIAILRGINVSGQKKIKMADLREYLAELDIRDISTYIQSGNVLFRSADPDQVALAQQITDKIEEKYGFKVPVIVKNVEEVRQVWNENPFLNGREEDITKLLVTFLASPPDPELAAAVEGSRFEPDEFVIRDQGVYLFCPNGFGRSKVTNNFWERKLKVMATSRNWKTVTKLLALADAMHE